MSGSQDIERPDDPYRDARQRARCEALKFVVPATATEAAWVEELLARPVGFARRVAADEALRLGMQENQCHANVATFCRHLPAATAVAGWMVRGSLFIFHSVVEQDGELVCVTPSPGGGGFGFIPDVEITRIAHPSGIEVFRRGGSAVPSVLRQSPLATIADYAAFIERLDAEMCLDQAAKMLTE